MLNNNYLHITETVAGNGVYLYTSACDRFIGCQNYNCIILLQRLQYDAVRLVYDGGVQRG